MLIAHISDFHLKPRGVLAYEQADTAGSLERTIAHLNVFQPRPDVVLITGDLVDEGHPESYVLLRELLGRLQIPFFIVPGNHDHKPSLRRAFPEHAYLAGNNPESPANCLCFTVEDYPLRLVGVDSVNPGEHGGGLSKERLQWLEKSLAARPYQPTVVFMHHPPFPSGIGHMDQEPFQGRDVLAVLLERNPQVQRILCGHIHRPISRMFGGTCTTVAPGVGMQLVLDLREEAPSAFIMEPPAVMLHYWNNLWGQWNLLTHVSLVPDHVGQYRGPYPFFDVINPGADT